MGMGSKGPGVVNIGVKNNIIEATVARILLKLSYRRVIQISVCSQSSCDWIHLITKLTPELLSNCSYTKFDDS